MKVAVIGAGHNGLVAGLELARAGAEVVVLEQGSQAGGCLWSERSASGVLIERGAFEHGGVVGLAEELGLADFGLRYADHPLLAGMVFGDGERRLFGVELERTAAGLGADAENYRELGRLAGALFGVLDGFGPVPPTLTEVAAALAGLKGGDALFRTLIQPAELVIAAAVQDPHTRGSLELYAAHGQVPPWAPGSGMFGLLLPAMHGGRATRPVGGSAMLTDALAAALAAAGGRLLLDTPVTGLRPAGRGAAVAVPGEQFAVDAVVATVDVRRVARLVEGLPADLLGSIAQAHSGHFNVAELTVSIVTDPAPPLDHFADDPEAVWFVQDAPGGLRQGFAEVLAGQPPRRPWTMLAQVGQPETADGAALWLSSVVPLCRTDGGWTRGREAEAAEIVVDTASEVLGTDLAAGERERQVTGPVEWAGRLASDGNPNHLDLSLDQLLGWRPAGLAAWRERYPWLHWAGAGVHPGGGLSGDSGRAAARAVLGPGDRRRAGSELAGLWSAFRAYLAMRRR